MENKQLNLSEPENIMGTMDVNPLLIKLSIPMMISMLVQALYNVVDSIFVARVSENALTAVSLAFSLQNLMFAVGIGTGVGVNALLSKSLGEKNQYRANKTAVNESDKKKNQTAGRADGRKCLLAQITADHKGIRNIVKLLKKLPDKDRQRKQTDFAVNLAFRHESAPFRTFFLIIVPCCPFVNSEKTVEVGARGRTKRQRTDGVQKLLCGD